MPDNNNRFSQAQPYTSQQTSIETLAPISISVPTSSMTPSLIRMINSSKSTSVSVPEQSTIVLSPQPNTMVASSSSDEAKIESTSPVTIHVPSQASVAVEAHELNDT